MTSLLPRLNWAERILAELKSRPQPKDTPYVFLTSCIGAEGRDIDAMLETAEVASLGEVRHNCDLSQFEDALGYSQSGLALQDDHHVSYGRSRYRGVRCYYLDHSSIEYIWVCARDWQAERLKRALDQAGVVAHLGEVRDE